MESQAMLHPPRYPFRSFKTKRAFVIFPLGCCGCAYAVFLGVNLSFRS